jgi:hypothetical protein
LFFIYARFAFTLWLFHDKRNGTILTMGFYTTLFFFFTFIDSILIDKGMLLFDPTPAVEWINFSIKSIGFSDDLLFLTHRLLLPAVILKSLYKSSLIILINLAAMIVLVVLFALYTFNAIH